MLALAITMLFTLTGVISALVIADNLLKARAAYARLSREREVLRAGLALQAAAVEQRARPVAARQPSLRLRPAPLRPLPRQACAAA